MLRNSIRPLLFIQQSTSSFVRKPPHLVSLWSFRCSAVCIRHFFPCSVNESLFNVYLLTHSVLSTTIAAVREHMGALFKVSWN